MGRSLAAYRPTGNRRKLTGSARESFFSIERHWGKGLGFESLGLWIEYLFRSLPQIARLDMRTWWRNIGLIKLAGKLGLWKENITTASALAFYEKSGRRGSL